MQEQALLAGVTSLGAVPTAVTSIVFFALWRLRPGLRHNLLWSIAYAFLTLAVLAGALFIGEAESSVQLLLGTGSGLSTLTFLILFFAFHSAGGYRFTLGADRWDLVVIVCAVSFAAIAALTSVGPPAGPWGSGIVVMALFVWQGYLLRRAQSLGAIVLLLAIARGTAVIVRPLFLEREWLFPYFALTSATTMLFAVAVLLASILREQRLAQTANEELQRAAEQVRQQAADIEGLAQRYREQRDEAVRAGEALRETQALLVEAQRLGKLGHVLSDRVSNRVYWSDSLFELRGVAPRPFFTVEETVHVPLLHPDDLPRFSAARDAGIAEHRDFAIDIKVQHPQGGIRWEHVVGHPRFGPDGTLTAILYVLLDITERKEAEIALRHIQELLLAAQRLGRVGYIEADLRSQRIYWSDTVFEIRGVPKRPFFTPEEALGYIHPEDRPLYFAARNKAVAERSDFEIDVRILHGDGSIRWEHSVGRPRFDEEGKLFGLLVVLVDITERKQAEEVLRWSEERLRALIENSNDLIVVIQPDGTITYRGPSMSEGLGYDAGEVIGRQVLDFVYPDDEAAVTAVLRTVGSAPGLHATGRGRFRHRDGSWRHIAWSARNATHIPGVAGIVFNCHDVTEARLLEERLQQSQKMEAVGQLAGGIAHDFNNIIGAILGFAGFLLQDLPPGTTERSFAERIVMAGNRARDLVQQILAFSRRAPVDRTRANLAAIVRDTCDLLLASLPSSTELNVVVEDEDLVGEVNVAQVSQVLLNLCLNANDSLASHPGCVMVTLSRFCADGEAPPLDGDAAAATIALRTLERGTSYARIQVADTGGGMTAEVLQRIFDPFFTTKERGRGTGLGLAVVDGVVAAYKGALTVASCLGHGTTVAVYLPVVEPDAVPAAAPPTADPRGGERILLVDDDDDFTEMLRIGLERLGYTVVAVDDPERAVAVFGEAPASWGAVISDQVMPRMKGTTLFHRLSAIRPGLPFVLCSGFSAGTSEETARAAGIPAFFLKPVSPEQLAACMRRLLDPRGPTTA